MDGVASFSARVPGATVTVWPTTEAAMLSAVIAVAALAACIERQSMRAVFTGASAAVLLDSSIACARATFSRLPTLMSSLECTRKRQLRVP